MELTLKYYHNFSDNNDKLGKDLNRPESWDVLRVSGCAANNPFYIPESRDQWVQLCLEDKALGLKARKIAEFLNESFEHIYSFGVGSARLEYLIKKENTAFHLHCFDFAPEGIARLKKVFSEADEIDCFDMIQGSWSNISSSGVCLLYRVDTVFDDHQWRTVFSRMKRAGIKHILFIPSDILTLRRIVYQQVKRVIFKLIGRKMIFSGFVRTEKRFLSLLGEFYHIDQVVLTHGLKGFSLTLRET